MDVAVKGEREFEHVLEISGEHRVAAAMGEAVGIEGDQRAAQDVEHSEADPDQQQRKQIRPDRGCVGGLGRGEGVDHAPEQHRFGELSRGKREIGAALLAGKPDPSSRFSRSLGGGDASADGRFGFTFGWVEARPGAVDRKPAHRPTACWSSCTKLYFGRVPRIRIRGYRRPSLASRDRTLH